MNTNFCIFYLEEGYSGLAIQLIQANYGCGGGGMVSTIGCCIGGGGDGGQILSAGNTPVNFLRSRHPMLL